MDKAGGIIALIAGVLGIVAGFFTLFVGGIGSAFEAKEADSILNLAWVGIAAAMLVVIGGGVSLARPRGGGMVAVFAAVVGIVYGGSLVAICLALGLIGGCLAVLAPPPKAGERDAAEPARKRWQALGMSLGAGITVVVIATLIEQNGNEAGSGANPQSNAAKTSWPSMGMDQTASENRSAVLPAQPAPSEPAGLGIYRLGGSTLEFAAQPDGALTFKLLIVSDNGNTGEAEGLLQPREGVTVWKNADFECELTFHWQGNAVKLDQKGGCGFGVGVDGSGVYAR
jgi:hypothetical protein